MECKAVFILASSAQGKLRKLGLAWLVYRLYFKVLKWLQAILFNSKASTLNQLIFKMNASDLFSLND
jgi:hypothetical protein